MSEPNALDPIEKLLAAQPLEHVPDAVYTRLEKKASWNRPSRGPVVGALVGLIVTAVVAVVVLYIVFATKGPTPVVPGSAPDIAPTLMTPASAPIIARVVPAVGPEHETGADEVGGLSTRWSTQEPQFEVGFGEEANQMRGWRATADS